MIPIVLDTALAEEAVLRAVAGQRREPEFRAAREAIYGIGDAGERERAFADLHIDWFAELDLGRPLRTALSELPALTERCARCVVRAARRAADEGADLLVADGGERTAIVHLRPEPFGAPEALLDFLRGELLHVADMVDPAFGYDPELPLTDAGPSRTPLLRERYRAVWEVRVAGRLQRRGVLGAARLGAARRAFIRAFPMLGESGEAAFDRFFADAATHGDILAFVLEPRGPHAGIGLRPGESCPVCRFPTHAPEPEAHALPAAVVGAIRADFPSWRPAAGLCRQCADLYRARCAAA